MGWVRTVKSINATAKRMERESQRKQRELQRQEKNFSKMEALEQASYEVDVYENYLELLQSVHKEWGELIDWRGISELDEPLEPQKIVRYEKEFKAGFFTKLLGNVEKEKLKAIKKDTDTFLIKHKQWEKDCKEWEINKLLAKKLLNHDEETQVEIIEKFNPFNDIGGLDGTLRFQTNTNGIIEVTLVTDGGKIVPSEIKSLLKSGKLSVKSMPKGRYNELYQDYICSCVLRIGNELLAIIPEERVIVHVLDKVFDSKTGHTSNKCILSISITIEVIANLNMDKIDPSDALANFEHHMKFKKTKGFEEVEKLFAVETIQFNLN
jgi:hypothetical protein